MSNGTGGSPLHGGSSLQSPTPDLAPISEVVNGMEETQNVEIPSSDHNSVVNGSRDIHEEEVALKSHKSLPHKPEPEIPHLEPTVAQEKDVIVTGEETAAVLSSVAEQEEITHHGIDMNVESQVETEKEVSAKNERIDCDEPGTIEDSAMTTTQQADVMKPAAPVEVANEDISHLEPESNHTNPEVEINDVSAEEEHMSAPDSNITHCAEITSSDTAVETSTAREGSASREMSQELPVTAHEAEIGDDMEKSDPKEMSLELEKVDENIEVSSKEILEPGEPISSESAQENATILEEQQPESRDIVEHLASAAEKSSNNPVDEVPASAQENEPEHEMVIEKAETESERHEGSGKSEHNSLPQNNSETEPKAELQAIHEAESHESSSPLKSESIQPAVVEIEIVPQPRDLDNVLERTQVSTEETVPEPRDLDAELSANHEPIGAEHEHDLVPEPRDLDAISGFANPEPECVPEPRDLDASPEPAILEHGIDPECRDLDMDKNPAKSEPDVSFEPRDLDAKAQTSPEPQSTIPEHSTVPEPRDLDTSADLKSSDPNSVSEPRDLDAKIESSLEPAIPEHEVIPEPRDLNSKLEASPETDSPTLEESSINKDQEVLSSLAKGAEEEPTTHVHAEDQHADVESKELTTQEDYENTVRAVDEPKIDNGEETLPQSEDKSLDSTDVLGDKSSDLAHGVPAEVDEHDQKLQDLPAEVQEMVATASEDVKIKVKDISSDSAEVPSDGPEHINIDAEHGPDGTSIEQPGSLQASVHTDQAEDTDAHRSLEHAISSENSDAIDHHAAPSVEADLETPLEANGQDGPLSEQKEVVPQSEEPDLSREVNLVMPTQEVESEPKEAVSPGEASDLSREANLVMPTHEVESEPTGIEADIDHEVVHEQMKTDTEELPSNSVNPQDIQESHDVPAETRDEKEEHNDISLERESTEEATNGQTTGLAQPEVASSSENVLSNHEIVTGNPTELEHSTAVVNEEPVSHQDVSDSSELKPEQSSSHEDAVDLPKISVDHQHDPGVDERPEEPDDSHVNGSPPDSAENAGFDDTETIKDTVKSEEIESSNASEELPIQGHELPPASLENDPETESISASKDGANSIHTTTSDLSAKEPDKNERQEIVVTSPVMPEHDWMKKEKPSGPVLHDTDEKESSEKIADEDDSNHIVPMAENILPKEVTEKDVLVDEPPHKIEAPHVADHDAYIKQEGLPAPIDHVKQSPAIGLPLTTAVDSIPDETTAVDAQVDTSSHGVPLNDKVVVPHSDATSNNSLALEPELKASHSKPESPKPLRRTDSNPEHNGVRLRQLAQVLLAESDEPITDKAPTDVFKYLEPETAENEETEVDDTLDEGSVRDGAPLNGSTGPHDHRIMPAENRNEDLKGPLTPTQHQAIADITHINRFAESPATVLNTDDLFNDDTDSENSDSEEGDDADEEDDDDDDDDDDEEEEDEETYDDEDDDDEDADEDEEEEESDEAAPEPVKIPSKVEQSSPPVLHNMPSFAKPKMVDPFSEGPQDQADVLSSHASSRLFASLVDTIRSDIPAVKQMVHNGDTGKSLPNRQDGDDEYHSLSDQATERRVDVPNAFQDTDEEQAPFHDTFTHQDSLTNLHARSLTSDTVPSFESYAQSDAESNPSEMPPSPVQEASSQEPKIASSWPSNEQSAEEKHELKPEASPCRAEFDPMTGVANYPKFVTPKPSQANLKSPRSSRFPQSVDSAKRQYSPRGSTSPTSRRFSRSSTGEASQVADSPPSKRLSMRDSGASLREAYNSPTKPHSPTTQRPTPPASETKPTALGKNTTSPSIPSNSFFQKTRSLFEAQSSPSLPSAVTRPLSGYFNVGRGASASTSPQPERKGSMASLRNSLPASLAMSAEPALHEEDNFMPRSLDADGQPPSPVFSIPLRRDSGSSQRDRKSSHGSISRVENDLNTFIPSKNIRPRSSNPFLGLGAGNNTERGLRNESERQREPLLGRRDSDTWGTTGGGTRVGDGS